MKNNKDWEELLLEKAESHTNNTVNLLLKMYNEVYDNFKREVEIFYNRYIVHKTEKFTNFELIYEKLNKDELNNIDKKYLNIIKGKFRRIDILKIEVFKLLQKLNNREYEIIEKSLKQQYKELFKTSMFNNQKNLNIGFEFNTPNTKAIEILINNRWLDNNIDGRLNTATKELYKNLEIELLKGFAAGESPKIIAQRLSHKTNTNLNKAISLVRTETNRILNEANYNSIKEINKILGEDTFTEYQIISTLDSRTSSICQEMDLKKFKIDDKVVGINFPPFHPRCRTTIKIVTNKKEVNERIAKRLDNKNVEYIPSNISYKEWAKKFDIENK